MGAAKSGYYVKRLSPQFYYPERCLNQSVGAKCRRGELAIVNYPDQSTDDSRIPHSRWRGVWEQGAHHRVRSRERSAAMGHCWLAIANSFVFDGWLVELSPLQSTTLAPGFADATNQSKRQRGKASLLACTAAVRQLSRGPMGGAELRAEIEWRVLAAYGQGVDSLRRILSDFPSLRLLGNSAPRRAGFHSD